MTAAASQLVYAAVADVDPVRARALHQAGGAGGAGPDLRREAAAESDHRFVRAADRKMQETFGIEYRAARVPEVADHRAYGRLGGTGAVRVPTHAVDDGKQRGAVADRDGDPVLVFFAIPEKAQIRVLDVQVSLQHACFYCRLWRDFITFRAAYR